MADNLNIKGIESDEPSRHRRKKHGRKRFVLECRYTPNNWFDSEWRVYSRYHTPAARDEAYAALVKRNEGLGWYCFDFRIPE